METSAVQYDSDMGPKARRMPPAPRLLLNGMEILPALDDNWHPVDGMWVLPGGRKATFFEVALIAAENGWSLSQKYN